MLESVINWFIGKYTTRFLLLHAGVVERDGRAIVLPASSGSGKSTLCAALVARGWRLLSDEFAMVRPSDGQIQPHPRPICLKNASIDVIVRELPDAHFSKRYEGTTKGTVADVRAPREAIEKADETANPVLVVFPRYLPDEQTALKSIEKAQALMFLINHSVNYFTMLDSGFEALAAVVDGSDQYTLVYRDLVEAISLIEGLEPVSRGIESVE